MKPLRIRAAVRLPLLIVLALAISVGSATAAESAKPSVVHSARITGAFSATVIGGAGAGTSYKGTLRLAGTRTGLLSGTLRMAGGETIPVSGQLRGELIGLTFAVAPGKTISGTGIVGYDQASRRNTIGGTFAGPGPGSLGVWGYFCPVIPFANGNGGCLVGITAGNGLCYVVS
jgi:hypothetical protein